MVSNAKAATYPTTTTANQAAWSWEARRDTVAATSVTIAQANNHHLFTVTKLLPHRIGPLQRPSREGRTCDDRADPSCRPGGLTGMTKRPESVRLGVGVRR